MQCAEQFSDGVAFDPHAVNYLYILTEIGQNPICVFFYYVYHSSMQMPSALSKKQLDWAPKPNISFLFLIDLFYSAGMSI